MLFFSNFPIEVQNVKITTYSLNENEPEKEKRELYDSEIKERIEES